MSVIYQSKEQVLINSMENTTDNVRFEIKKIELDYENDTYTVNGMYSSSTRIIKPVYKRIKKADRELTFKDVETLSSEFLNENAFWGLSSEDYEILN